jgi:four helix bundle protein
MRLSMLQNFRTYHLAVELYGHCETVQARHHLKDQLLRSSLSVVLNLSEGSAKPTAKDRRRFYAIALGSCRETQTLLRLTHRPDLLELSDRLGASLYLLTYSQ